MIISIIRKKVDILYKILFIILTATQTLMRLPIHVIQTSFSSNFITQFVTVNTTVMGSIPYRRKELFSLFWYFNKIKYGVLALDSLCLTRFIRIQREANR